MFYWTINIFIYLFKVRETAYIYRDLQQVYRMPLLYLPVLAIQIPLQLRAEDKSYIVIKLLHPFEKFKLISQTMGFEANALEAAQKNKAPNIFIGHMTWIAVI